MHLEEYGTDYPATHTYGAHPIGGIWTTKGIKVDAIGYQEIFIGVVGEHQLLWGDISFIE